MTYAPGKFVVATFNDLGGNAFQENTLSDLDLEFKVRKVVTYLVY